MADYCGGSGRNSLQTSQMNLSEILRTRIKRVHYLSSILLWGGEYGINLVSGRIMKS